MGYRVNVRNFKRAQVTADTNSSYTLGTVVPIPTLRSIDITMTTSSGSLYGDGEKVSEVSLVTGATLQFGIDKLSAADKVAIFGVSKSAKGIQSYKTTDTPVKTAVYFEIVHERWQYLHC